MIALGESDGAADEEFQITPIGELDGGAVQASTQTESGSPMAPVPYLARPPVKE